MARTRWCARLSTLAIDRAALVQCRVQRHVCAERAGGAAKFTVSTIAALTPPPRDVAKAKALLKQAGVSLPVKVELLTSNQPDILQAAEVVQSMVAEAGFRRAHPGDGVRFIACRRRSAAITRLT